MGTAFMIVFLSILIGIGFARSRPKGAVATSIDRVFVGLVVLAVMLPALIAGLLTQRSPAVPWGECAAIFVATVGVSCAPLGIAQLIHRIQLGKWRTSKSSLPNIADQH